MDNLLKTYLSLWRSKEPEDYLAQLAVLLAAKKHFPNDTDVLHLLACVYHHIGDEEVADFYVNKARV